MERLLWCDRRQGSQELPAGTADPESANAGATHREGTDEEMTASLFGSPQDGNQVEMGGGLIHGTGNTRRSRSVGTATGDGVSWARYTRGERTGEREAARGTGTGDSRGKWSGGGLRVDSRGEPRGDMGVEPGDSPRA
ncbi:uncharacterized protein A4U43_C01F19610 [Asparagus officinalis]|uniref:Uncharacterized protein n=1 Tax=Asparagus officinalis TaxID=4686 RepID=A0A5P1FQW6_ASPOF|nr:uncharacterized protein A4U43_C01F19610 [Asparagus officinalis]